MGSNGLRRLEERDGYLPIADHGLLGDGRGSALVGRDGAVSFMCVPRFDSPPLFCDLLDNRHGGRFLVAPDGLHSSSQRYVDDTAVLVTRLQTPTGVAEVTDAFLLRPEALLEEDERAGAHVLARRVHVLAGSVEARTPPATRRRPHRAAGRQLAPHLCPAGRLSPSWIVAPLARLRLHAAVALRREAGAHAQLGRARADLRRMGRLGARGHRPGVAALVGAGGA
ncbi:trehalase-like domain-containing protein [Streptomyces sp. NPDC054802]